MKAQATNIEPCEFCGEEDCRARCDYCGEAANGRTCASCGHRTCEMEAMDVGDARERQGLAREANHEEAP